MRKSSLRRAKTLCAAQNRRCLIKRFPPFPHKPWQNRYARITVYRKDYVLGPWSDQLACWTEYNRLLKQWTEQGAAGFQQNGHTAASPTVAQLVGEFLTWCQLHQAPETYGFYLSHTRAVVADVGDALAADLRNFHITRLVDGKLAAKDWNVTTAFNAKRAIFRVFSWATAEGRIPSNPLAGMKRPQPPPRPRALTDDEHRTMMRSSRPDFRRLLLALRLTGARPKELRGLQWADWKGDRFVIARHKTSSLDRKRRDRVIYLAPVMQRLVAWLRRNNEKPKTDNNMRGNMRDGNGYVFVTSAGRPWTRSGMYQRIRRLKQKCGLADDTVSYLYRHQYINRALINGVSPAALAELCGNSADMIGKVYSHLDKEGAFLAAEAERAARTPPRPKAG